MPAPLHIALELSRADHPGDPYAVRFGYERYLVRLGPGQYQDTELDWADPGLLEGLRRIQGPTPSAEHAQRLGERLRRFLEPSGWAEHEARIAAALGARRPVRLTIVSGAAELYALPWELVPLATGERLCELPDCIVRYRWPGVRAPERPRGRSFGDGAHVLIAWSAAGGSVPAPAHLRAIEEAVAAESPPGASRARVTVLPHASREGLRAALDRALEEGAPVTVLHLLCHGAVADETAHLVWDDGAGAQDLVDPGALRRLLGPYAASLRLAVLCACGSGQPGGLASRLGSLAQALHRGAAQAPGGIEAVIASRFPLSTAGSCLLAEAFYPALLRDGLDAAFLAARGRMDPTGGAAAPGSLDHAALQVYAGAEEGAAGGAPAREDRPPSNLPARRAFVGRDEALGRLDEALGRAQRVSLVGIGGVGKTALAFEHAHRALERGAYPGGVWWIPAAGKPLDALLRLATALRACAPGRLDHVRPEAPAEEQAEAARIALQREPSPSLLVLDHVTEPGFLERIPGGEVRVLATARERRLAIGPPIALDPLDLPDARALAAQIAGAPADGAEAAACDRVVGRALGGLPVAVEVSARAAASWAGGWVAYEGYLAEQMAEALDDPRDRSELYPAGVLAALDASIARCPPGSPERALLEGASVFAPDAVPLAWAYGAAGVDAGGGAAGTPAARPAPPGGVPLAWKKALAALEGLLLVEVDREHATLSMHRLIDLRVAHAADPERWITASRRGAEHVAAWIGRAAGPARAQLEALDAARPHVEEALGAAERAGAEPAWIRIAHGLALHLRHRARFEEARAWSERALEKAERPAPSSPHLVAVSLSNLALLHVDRGRPAEGQPLLARALAVAEQAHGEDHPMVATILSNLALVHKDMGKPAEARPLLERALAIVEKGYGADHPHVATILSNLAKVLGDAGQAAEGRPLLERALAIHEKAYGAEHPRVAMDLSDLGSLARRTGDALGAQSLLERALAIHESTYGPSHPEVAKSLSNLAVVLRDLGRPTEARPLLERALAIDQAASGPAHPSVATRLLNLSAVLIDLGQVAEARPLLERAAAIAGEALPAAHPLRATLAQRLAHLGPGLGRAG